MTATSLLPSTTTRELPSTTLVIVGAGYAGVLAANRVAGRAPRGACVVLVNEREEFIHRVRLHEHLAGTRTQRYALGELLHPRVTLVHDRVERIDTVRSECVLTRNGPLHYDQLLLTVGSHIGSDVAGAREHGVGLRTPEDAERVAGRIARLPRGAHVNVLGAGYTGIEVAAELAEAHPRLRVTLVGDQLALGWPAPLIERVTRELGALGVRLRLGVRVATVEADHIVLEDGHRMASDVSIVTSGFQSPALLAESGLPVDAVGRVCVDETLRVVGHPRVLAAGDAAAVPLVCAGTGVTPLRMACATAMPTAAHAADVMVDQCAARPPRSFRYSNTVQCLSLGRRRGLLVFIDRDDRPTGAVLSGRAGAWAKELICRAVVGTLRAERALPGLFQWPGRWRSRRVTRTPEPALQLERGEP